MSHSYSSDISREQFARILPCLESARRRTKPESTDGGRQVSVLKWSKGAPLNLG